MSVVVGSKERSAQTLQGSAETVAQTVVGVDPVLLLAAVARLGEGLYRIVVVAGVACTGVEAHVLAFEGVSDDWRGGGAHVERRESVLVAHSIARIVLAGGVGGDVGGETQIAGEFDLQVGPEVVTAVGGVDDRSLLVHHSERSVVPDLARRAGCGNIVLLLQPGAEHQVEPVGLAEYRAAVVFEHRILNGRVVRRGEPVKGVGQIAVVHEILGVEVFWYGRVGGGCQRCVELDSRSVSAPLLGGDEDYAVGTLHSVDGSRSVLQHRDALYVRRVDVAHLTFHPVHYHQRAVASDVLAVVAHTVEGVDAADHKLGIVITRTTAGLDARKSRHLASEHVGKGRNRSLDQLF